MCVCVGVFLVKLRESNTHLEIMSASEQYLVDSRWVSSSKQNDDCLKFATPTVYLINHLSLADISYLRVLKFYSCVLLSRAHGWYVHQMIYSTLVLNLRRNKKDMDMNT